MKLGGLSAILLLTASAGAARPTPPAPSAALKEMAACRATMDDAARLACYDRAAGALLDAEKRHDLLVVDREQVKETRKRLFGLTLPNLDLFGGRTDKGEEIDRIETTLRSGGKDIGGRWTFVLADGARWRQIDDYELFRSPKAGDKVVVTRAALGSYKLSVAGGSAVRVHREN